MAAVRSVVPSTLGLASWRRGSRRRPSAARPPHTALVAVNASGADIIETSAELLARLSYGERDEGIVPILAQPSTELAGLDLPAEPLIAVLERVEKPGNLGAVLRSADGAGVDAVIVADSWNPNAIRASLGTIFSTPLAVAAAPDALEFLRERGLDIIAARVDAKLDYDQADMRGAVAIVLGSENAGLSETWAGDGITSVRIPMLGRVDSLNVSASAAILLYEARRQRHAPEQRHRSPERRTWDSSPSSSSSPSKPGSLRRLQESIGGSAHGDQRGASHPALRLARVGRWPPGREHRDLRRR